MLWVGILYAVICFFLQTVLFRKTEKRMLHFMPLILIGVIYTVCLCLPVLDGVMSALGRNDGYSFYGFAAMLAALVNTFGLVSVGIAWLIQKV